MKRCLELIERLGFPEYDRSSGLLWSFIVFFSKLLSDFGRSDEKLNGRTSKDWFLSTSTASAESRDRSVVGREVSSVDPDVTVLLGTGKPILIKGS